MTRRARVVVTCSFLVALVTVLTGCSSDRPEVRASISRHHLVLDPPAIEPGRTSIVAVNRDSVVHDLHVVRISDPKPLHPDHAAGGHGEEDGVPSVDAMLRDSRGAVFESEIPTKALTGAISRVPAGSSARIPVTLKRGSYVVFCNMVRKSPDGGVDSDFANGEYAVLRVR